MSAQSTEGDGGAIAALAYAMDTIGDIDTCVNLMGRCYACLGALHKCRIDLLAKHGADGRSVWLEAHDAALLKRCAEAGRDAALSGDSVPAAIRALKGEPCEK